MSTTYKCKSKNKEVVKFIGELSVRNGNEHEFLQAVEEVAEYILPYLKDNPKYVKAKIFERMCEPERVVSFRVPWIDDKGEFQINRAFRIQMNSAIGPYKGGMRFHPSVNQGILKFLAFEQTLKNSLTTLPMGGGKGGSDFDPKGKSDNEVMRFCQSLMTELTRFLGPDTDVPAGDIGVGGREVGFMFGQYKRLANEFTGVFTGKGYAFGGSLIRPEATGYGLVYFVSEMMKEKGITLKDKTVVVSGSGNVAQYAIEKCIQLGAKVVTASDSSGFIYDPKGFTKEKLAFLMELKNVRRGRIKEYADKYKCEFIDSKTVWSVKCDVALPCATQNELQEDDAKMLIKNSCKVVGEGANMPTTIGAIELLQKAGVMFSPGKASNAGGVATSGLEMTQNSLRYSWSREEVDAKLKQIMVGIHQACVKYGKEKDGSINYVKGANLAGFVKVADAMLGQGHV